MTRWESRQVRGGPAGSSTVVDLLFVGWASISLCSCREAPLVEPSSNPSGQPIRNHTVPRQVIFRRDRRWFAVMTTMLAAMMPIAVVAGIVTTGIADGLAPVSVVEVIQRKMRDLHGEFA